jgi:type II secretory ATPase GspE/PulE/Tfp pilus assembly ATPase PilB-like protein
MEAAELPASPVVPAGAFGAPTPIGVLLVGAGHLTPDQLEQALAEQRGLLEHVRLGEILVARNWITRKALAQALAEQHGLEFVDLARVEVEPDAASLLTEQFARRAQVLPVRLLGDDLVQVAIADPTNLRTADDLKLALGLNIRLAVADASALEGTIERTYRVHIEITGDGDDVGAAVSLDDVLARGDGEAPTIELVNSILSRAISEGASDVHFDPQPNETIVRARIDGVLRRMAEIPKAMEVAVLGRLKVMGQLDIAEKRLPQDGSFSIRHGEHPVDVRVAVVPTKHGEHVVLRLLQRAVRLDLPELGLSRENQAAFVASVHQPYGAVIACGPTGSGKTTTLYAALDMLNEEGRAITTIEDPVEYQLPGVNQVEAHAKIGLSFSRGLRTILRSDPDVLLVGEIRDEETAQIAVQAAMTGHLVLTTLHTNDAPSAVARLKNMGVDPALLAASVNCIVAQRLARRLCTHCREAYEPDESELRAAGLSRDNSSRVLYRAHGCLQCSGTGYRGRIAVYEVLPIHGRVRTAVEGSTEELLEAGIEQGMTTLRQDGLRLCLDAVTSLDEVRRVIGDQIG